jgi:oxidase EvaA
MSPLNRGFLASTIARRSPFFPAEDVRDWLASRERAHRFSTRQDSVRELESWNFDPRTGTSAMLPGRFFTVEGSDRSPPTIPQRALTASRS